MDGDVRWGLRSFAASRIGTLVHFSISDKVVVIICRRLVLIRLKI